MNKAGVFVIGDPSGITAGIPYIFGTVGWPENKVVPDGYASCPCFFSYRLPDSQCCLQGGFDP